MYRVNLSSCQGIQAAPFHSTHMEGAYRKRRFIYRVARGAAAWRPAVMWIVPSADGRETTLHGRDRQSQAYVRSFDQDR